MPPSCSPASSSSSSTPRLIATLLAVSACVCLLTGHASASAASPSLGRGLRAATRTRTRTAARSGVGVGVFPITTTAAAAAATTMMPMTSGALDQCHKSRAAGKRLVGGAVAQPSAPTEVRANDPEDSDKSLLPQDVPFGVPEIREEFERVLMKAQDDICRALEEVDGEAKFEQDRWLKSTGGGGRSRVLQDGKVFEKAGINLSVLKGALPYEFVSKRGECPGFEPGERIPYVGMGLSSVIHPKNPFAPTMHFNYRLFQTECGVWWFGGGTDITPSYIDEDDMKHFHGTYKRVCDKHDPGFYGKFKKWADEYFVIKHRGETRGLGGIFSDDMNDRDPKKLLEFYTDAVNSVIESFVPIVEKHKNDEFTEKQKEWQGMRRGRSEDPVLIREIKGQAQPVISALTLHLLGTSSSI